MVNMVIPRDQLEQVIQKKKILELEAWFNQHFVNSSRADYINRCPILIIQGPTGSGKTACLETIARDLKIQIREYSETTDVTAVDNEICRPNNGDREERGNVSLTIDRRKASRFEHFVINNIRFNPLYPSPQEQSNLPSADSEFEDDDDEFFAPMSKPPPPPTGRGVIIHIQSQLSFARSHRIFVQSISKLIKTIKDISRVSTRRAAIVFEGLESNGEVINTLPAKFKSSFGVQTIKFNPIIRTNMRKFVENQLKAIDRESIEFLINDCDGDMNACLNSIEFMRVGTHNLNDDFQNSVRVSKKLKREVIKSVSFFHTLGKIFYQKRLYPDRFKSQTDRRPTPLERPYPVENSPEALIQSIDVGPRDLTAWLHQHYHKFCDDFNIDRAATMMENLSDVDTISIDALQSSQFYEMHSHLDQLQLHLNIEATVFSLYKDQSDITKSSHKRVTTNDGTFILKSSVESSTGGNGDLYSFNRPISLVLPKIIQDHQALLDHLTSEIMKHDSTCRDQTKVLIDYVPYLSYISKNIPVNQARCFSANGSDHPALLLLDDKSIDKIVKVLVSMEFDRRVDLDSEHERLLELIEEVDEKVGQGVATNKAIAEN